MKKYAVLVIFLLSISPMANGLDFKPEQAPLLKNVKPRHNVFALFDDSASIVKINSTVQEHFLGYGDPVCVLPKNWNEIKSDPKYQAGKYYDPFGSGSYIPYDASKNFGFDGSIFVNECAEIDGAIAFRALLENFLLFYKDKFQLGFGGLSQNNTAALTWTSNYTRRYNVVANPIENLSKVPSSQWDSIYKNIYETFQSHIMADGWSPIFPALYNLSLYFRGYPFPLRSFGNQYGYVYQQYDSPLKYRCAKNHIVMFTDGRANRSYIDVFAENDRKLLAPSERGRSLDVATSIDPVTGEPTYYASLVAADLSNVLINNLYEELAYVDDGYTGSEDGKSYAYGFKGYDSLDLNRYDVSIRSKTKYNMANKTFLKLINQDLLQSSSVYNPSIDITGNAWSDTINGIPQALTVNALIFSQEPYQQFLNIINETNGKSAYQEGNLNFNTIFNKVTDMLVDEHSNFKYNNGYSIEDQYMRTKDTTRFVFYHDIYTNTGGIAAYNLDEDGKWNPAPSWRTDQTVRPQDGRFMTMRYENLGKKVPALLTLENIEKVFLSKYAEKDLNMSYLDWLRGIVSLNSGKPVSELSLKTRTSVVGPIVNAKPVFVARDREYINLNFVSDELGMEFEAYIQTKNQSMDNLIIANANDGLVHFISAEHGNKNGGYRKAAYFPGFLAARLPEIVGLDTPFAYNMDGQTNVFEFKGSDGAIQTVALSGMGGGGKGVVGYRLFKKQKDNSVDKSITPLFEIANEDGFAFNSPGFENLGYTYSGFEFVNIASTVRGTGQGIAVFGNGYGKAGSSLYLIDLETGNLLKEIQLSVDGGGASTPALIVRQDGGTGFQQLESAIVGDQAGRLYKVNFSSNNITNGNATVTIVYEPERLFDSPITVRPMIHSAKDTESLWVYFGTGRKADLDLDRGAKSKLQQYFIAINLSISNSTRKLSDLAKNTFNIVDGIVYMNLPADTKRSSGWFLEMPSFEGERIVYQPGITLDDDIVFSTWKLLEGADDICSDDIGAGLQFALNTLTGDIGKFKSHGVNVAGVEVNRRSPGVPSGTSISYQGYFSGGLDHGSISTMSSGTIDQLNENNHMTSHAKSADYLTKCLASTTAEVEGYMPEFCHDLVRKNLTNRRVSIRRRF